MNPRLGGTSSVSARSAPTLSAVLGSSGTLTPGQQEGDRDQGQVGSSEENNVLNVHFIFNGRLLFRRSLWWWRFECLTE